MTDQLEKVVRGVERFEKWLDDYGDASYDHQGLYAGFWGRKAKALYYRKPLIGTIAVSPMVACQTFFPSVRPLFSGKQRFPIADAHYAMGFALLYQVSEENKHYQRAVDFLKVLEETRCPGVEHYCWGYPFHWVTKNGTITQGTPLITITPYVYEAFASVYAIDRNPKWSQILHSIAEHALHDIRDFDMSADASSCAYSPLPDDRGGVINASAYRAVLLAHASMQFEDERYLKVAVRNLNFVLQTQQQDGSWRYSIDGGNDFIDHFHTCFVLKGLAKIEKLTGHRGCNKAIEKGIQYYVKELFDRKGLPKPFSRAPRLSIYRRVLYDYAECINLGVLLRNRFPELDERVSTVLTDLLDRWQKKDGSFYTRELFLGWDKVPMHRYAQSQIFRSLCFLLSEESRKSLSAKS